MKEKTNERFTVDRWSRKGRNEETGGAEIFALSSTYVRSRSRRRATVATLAIGTFVVTKRRAPGLHTLLVCTNTLFFRACDNFLLVFPALTTDDGYDLTPVASNYDVTRTTTIVRIGRRCQGVSQNEKRVSTA